MILYNKNIIAIDPGLGGGLARQCYTEVTAYKMPKVEEEIVTLLRNWVAGVPTVAYIERVSGYIGGAWNPGHHMFRFGANFGFLLGVLKTLGVEVKLVMPQKWQKSLGLKNDKKLARPAWKNFLKAEAQKRYPHLKINLQTSDALLILSSACLAESTQK